MTITRAMSRSNIELRPYQQEALASIPDAGAYLIQMAVGLGKTVTFSQIPRRGRMLILSHRDELVHQPAKYFDCSFGVEQAGETSHGEEVVSASVQSLVRRLDKFKPDDFDILITDECHHAAAPTYRKIYDYFKPRLHLGFTATPNRNDGVGLQEIYQDIIFQRDLKWGIKNGYLSNIKCLRVDIGYDLRRVAIRLGDYAPEALDEAVNIEKANKAVAEAYKLYAKPPCLIFCASISHAENLAALIPDAVAVRGGEDRTQTVQDFQRGKIPCLTNCMVFTEGTDIPNINTIIMARPTKNASLYCLDEKTEILTINGWKKDIEVGEQVAAYDIKTGKIMFSPAIAKIRRLLEEDEYFCSLKGQLSDIRVTNHHRMLAAIKGRKFHGYDFIEAKQLIERGCTHHIPVAGHMDFQGVPLTDAELTFIGWVMTDGSINKYTNQIIISQSSHHIEYCKEIEQCIIDCGFKYGKHINKRTGVKWKQNGNNITWTISRGIPRGRDKHLSGWARLEPYISKDLSPLLFDMTEKQFEIMLTAIWHADGHKNCWPKTKHIGKGNKTFIERLQIMAILRGYRASVSEIKRPGLQNMWMVHIKHQDFISVSSIHTKEHVHWIKEAHSNEYCWCVQNDMGTLVTRRNGKVSILGNCQMAGRATRLYPGKDHALIIDCVGVSKKLDFCTAPSLIGLDISEVPPRNLYKVQGDLFDLPDIVMQMSDCPEAWIRNVEYVDLWALNNNYNLHGVNYFKHPDGTLTVLDIQLPPEDSLGRIEYGGELLPAQKVFDLIYETLKEDYSDKKALWDLDLVKRWGDAPATDKQKDSVKRLFPALDVNALTKLEASQILARKYSIQEPATQKQKYFLRMHGFDTANLTKREAAKMIAEIRG